MSGTSKPKLYEFAGSCWAQTPKLAILESGYSKSDFEEVSVDLPHGGNFEEYYLKISDKGTVPALVVGDHTFTDSITVTNEIIKSAPTPMPTTANPDIIAATHAPQHDPNAIFLHSRSGEEREEKASGMVGGFIKGRQDALERLIKNPSSERKDYLEKTYKMNSGLNAVYQGKASDEDLQNFYTTVKQLWTNAGEYIRGPLTSAIKQGEGAFICGGKPGDADCHVAAWLARIATCAGAKQGDPDAITLVEKATGGAKFDDVIYKYWSAWIGRESFKSVGVN